MPAKLGRSARVEIWQGGVPAVVIESLAGVGPRASWPIHVSFDVEVSLDPEANRAKVSLYNLAKLTRDRIQGIVRRITTATEGQRLVLAGLGNAGPVDPAIADGVLGICHLKLFAGYGQVIQQIFEGDTQTIKHERESNVTTRTDLESADAGTRLRETIISKSWAPGTPVLTTIIDVAREAGLSVFPDTIARLTRWLSSTDPELGTTPALHEYGYTAQGPIRYVLDELISFSIILSDDEIVERIGLNLDAELRWSVVNGALVVYGPRDVLAQPPIVLTPQTGLIGRPRQLENGGVECQALLDPRLMPGATVALASRDVQGSFRVESSRFRGGTDGSGAHDVMIQCSSLDALGGIL